MSIKNCLRIPKTNVQISVCLDKNIPWLLYYYKSLGDYDVGVSSQAVFFDFVNGLLIQFKSNKLDPLKQSIVNLFEQTAWPWSYATLKNWAVLVVLNFFSLFLLFVLVAFFSICKSGNSFYNTTMGLSPLWSCKILLSSL